MNFIQAKLTKPGLFEYFEEKVPAVNFNDVLIKVTASGICSSEIPFFTGESVCSPKEFNKYASYPAPLGHEVVGDVIKFGEGVSKFKVGDRVTGITTTGSGFSSYYIEKEHNLILVPSSVKNIHALGEPIMCTMNILRSCKPEIGDSCLVVGDGFMSLLLLSLLVRYPFKKIILVGMNEKKLNLAVKIGATHIVSINDEDPYIFLEKMNGKDNFDICIDLAGNMKALSVAAWAVKPSKGRLVIPSYYHTNEAFSIGGYLMRKGPNLIPAHPAYSNDIKDDLVRGIESLKSGHFPMSKLVTHTFDFLNLNEAFEFASSKPNDYIKGVVTFSDT